MTWHEFAALGEGRSAVRLGGVLQTISTPGAVGADAGCQRPVSVSLERAHHPFSARLGVASAGARAAATRAQGRRGADQFRPRVPKAKTLMGQAEADVPAHMGARLKHGTERHRTSPSERVNGEITRRTDVAGILPDEAAIALLSGVILDRAVR